MKTYKLITNAEKLQFLTKFVHNTNHVKVDLQGILFAANYDVVASDGHTLCLFKNGWFYDMPMHEEPPAEDKLPDNGLGVYLTKEEIKLIKMLPPGLVTVEFVDCEPDNFSRCCTVLITGCNGMTIKASRLLGCYPDYQKVIPTLPPEKEPSFDYNPVNVVAVDPVLLERFSGYTKITKSKDTEALQLITRGKNNPITIKNSAAKNMLGLLMPMRSITFDDGGDE